MKVTHVNDHVTHAVIGGAKAIDFGISNSAEFFNILSSTLYKNQRLAMVRETLCNAWDAHIEFKCETTPVEITLTTGYLIIRDYGPGIPKDKIGPIYGTYGASTKKDDKGVTGGFGLGCKAPFAYTDHFEVTSWCEGVMTIYNLSKSNAEVEGKPSIMPIVSAPTQEHGIQVKIPIKSVDESTLRKMIHEVVHNGQMNMTLNGNPLPQMPFDTAKYNFIITQHTLLEVNAKIYLRYGNVIYPVEDHEEYNKAYTKTVNLLNLINKRSHYNTENWKIVFQAIPDTISVTPSRESLSMQKHTIASIKTLLEDFVVLSNGKLELESNKLIVERVKEIWTEKTIMDLFDPTQKIPGLQRKLDTENKAYLSDFQDFVKRYAYNSYPNYKGFYKKDLELRFKSMIDNNFGNKGLIQSFRSELFKEMKIEKKAKWGQKYNSNWFHRRIIWPLMRKMTPESGLKISKLMIYGEAKGNRHWKSVDFYMATKVEKRKMIQWLPYLRNIVILSFNRIDVKDRAPSFPELKEKLGSINETLVYVTPRAPAKVAEARKFFSDLGMTVIDLTVAQEWEPKTATAPIQNIYATPYKPRKKGLPLLSEIMDKNGAISTELAFEDEAKRIENFEFVVKFGARNNKDSLTEFNTQTTKLFVSMFGSKGGIIANENQLKSYEKKGIPNHIDYSLAKILDQFKTNPRIREYLAFDYTRMHGAEYNYDSVDYKYGAYFRSVFSDKDLVDYFELKNNLTQEDKNYIRLRQLYDDQYIGKYTSYDTEMMKEIKEIPLDQKIKDLYKKISKSRLIGTLDKSHVELIMTGVSYTKKEKETVRDILLTAIEG